MSGFVHPEDYSTWPQDRKNKWCADAAKAYDERRKTERDRAPLAYRARAYERGIKTLDGAELITAKFPPRSLMLSPWLPDKGLTMIFAPRGVGKTWMALEYRARRCDRRGILAVAGAEVSAASCNIDGEMPAEPCYKPDTWPLSRRR